MKPWQTYRDMLLESAAELGFEISEDPIQAGDTYLAQRNMGPKLLTCKKVDTENGWVVSTEELEYPYNISNCVKIIS